MAKSKGKGNNKQKDAKKRDAGSAEIKRAEDRLAGALAEVDDARKKVARRERDLAALMERHGRTAPIGNPDAEAIPLAAPSFIAIENRSAQAEPEAATPAMDEQPVAAHDGEQHG